MAVASTVPSSQSGSSDSSTGDPLTALRSTSSAVQQKGWASGGLGGGGADLGQLNETGSPLDALDAAGFSYLRSMVSFLDEPLQQLAGNSGSVSTAAEDYQNAGTKLSNYADSYRSAQKTQTTTWTGDAAQAYQSVGSQHADGIEALGQAANTINGAISGAGSAVAQTAQGVRQDISDAVSQMLPIMSQAKAQAASTNGASIAEAIPQCVQIAKAAGQKIQARMDALLSSSQGLKALVDKAGQAVDSVKQAFSSSNGPTNKTATQGTSNGSQSGSQTGSQTGTSPASTSTSPSAATSGSSDGGDSSGSGDSSGYSGDSGVSSGLGSGTSGDSGSGGYTVSPDTSGSSYTSPSTVGDGTSTSSTPYSVTPQSLSDGSSTSGLGGLSGGPASTVSSVLAGGLGTGSNASGSGSSSSLGKGASSGASAGEEEGGGASDGTGSTTASASKGASTGSSFAGAPMGARTTNSSDEEHKSKLPVVGEKGLFDPDEAETPSVIDTIPENEHDNVLPRRPEATDEEPVSLQAESSTGDESEDGDAEQEQAAPPAPKQVWRLSEDGELEQVPADKA